MSTFNPTSIPSLPSDIVSVHAGYPHSFALTSQGHLWAWVCNEEAQLDSFGSEHALAWTVDVKLFRWGYSWEEAIGKFPTKWEPHLVEELRGIEVIDIACGTDHSLVLCRPYHSLAMCQLDESNGANVGTTKIASWGWNQHCELGRWKFDELPNLVDGMDGEIDV